MIACQERDPRDPQKIKLCSIRAISLARTLPDSMYIFFVEEQKRSREWCKKYCTFDRIASFINAEWFLAHLSWKLKWAFLITCCPSSVCSSVCLSVCKLFTFSSSSPEPLGQFQPNLAQSILRWGGFKFVQMKGPALFQGEIITKKWKLMTKLKNLLHQNHWAYFNQTWHKASLGKGDSSLFKWRALSSSKGR